MEYWQRAITGDESCPEELLAIAIIVRAIDDWKQLADESRQQNANCNFTELRNFFLSDYCDVILGVSSYTGKYILQQLEEYRIEKMRERELQRIENQEGEKHGQHGN